MQVLMVVASIPFHNSELCAGEDQEIAVNGSIFNYRCSHVNNFTAYIVPGHMNPPPYVMVHLLAANCFSVRF